MTTYNFTDIENVVSRPVLIATVKNNLRELIKSNYTNYIKSDIGMIIISCVPLDSNYFIELDGRVVSKEVYSDLYTKYSDKFTNDKNDKYTLNTDKEFVLPNCYDRAMIMIDKSGTLDNSDRTLGSNLPWGINIDKLLDFDLSNQLKVIKNVEDSEEEDKNIHEIYSNIEIGKDAWITKNTKEYDIQENQYSLYPIRTSAKLQFNTRKIYFYTRYKHPIPCWVQGSIPSTSTLINLALQEHTMRLEEEKKKFSFVSGYILLHKNHPYERDRFMLHHSCGTSPQYQTNVNITTQLLNLNPPEDIKNLANSLLDALNNRAIFWGSCGHLWHDSIGYPMNQWINEIKKLCYV